jgi:hypothetical protein
MSEPAFSSTPVTVRIDLLNRENGDEGYEYSPPSPKDNLDFPLTKSRGCIVNLQVFSEREFGTKLIMHPITWGIKEYY